MDQGQEVRRDEALVDLRRVVVGLRVVAVDFGDAARLNVLRQEALPVADGEAEVAQAALVAAPRGVADDDRQHVNAQVVVIGPPDGALEKEAAVAAAQVEDDRGPAAEQRRPVEAALGGELLEGGLRPLRRVEDFAGDGDAELALDVTATLLLHEGIVPTGAGRDGGARDEGCGQAPRE